MDVRLRRQRHQKRDIVHASRRMREQVAYPFPRLAVLLPAPRARHDHTRVALEEFNLLTRIELLSGKFDQSRFVIKRVALARSPRHEQLNDAFRLGAMVQTAIELRLRLSSRIPAAQKAGERYSTEPAAPILKKSSSIHDSIDKKKFVGVEQKTAQIFESVLPRIRYVGMRLFRTRFTAERQVSGSLHLILEPP